MYQPIRNALLVALIATASATASAKPADDFPTALAKDCYLVKDDKLAKIPEDTFKDTQLYIVYYSHLHCGICVPVTKKLNTWHEANKADKKISLVFATRGDEDNDQLLTYVKKSAIKFPALDSKHYMNYIEGKGKDHAFYADADDGVPRFRFFDATGAEIDPRKHGASDIYKLSPDQLTALAAKMTETPE